jgi:hypothetical protein
MMQIQHYDIMTSKVTQLRSLLIAVKIGAVVPNVIMLSVDMVSVVAPQQQQEQHLLEHTTS